MILNLLAVDFKTYLRNRFSLGFSYIMTFYVFFVENLVT